VLKNRFGSDPRFSAVVVSGAPSAGKSSVLKALKKACEEAGCVAVIMSETPTELFNAGFSYEPELWQDPLDFQRQNELYSEEREERYYEAMKRLRTNKHLVLLLDRARKDPEAYIGRENYLQILAERGLDRHKLLCRYKAVIFLVTPALERAKHYTTENNAVRRENAAGAASLDAPTFNAWNGHPHLIVIDSTDNFEDKIRNSIRALSRVIPMPKAIEREHKFLLIGFQRSMLPPDAVTKEIVQDYLVRTNPDVERRVRMESADGGGTVLFYTEKTKQNEPGSRDEDENSITFYQYEKLLKEKDPERATIRKRRYSFRHSQRIVTVDEFLDVPGLWLAEIEVPDMTEQVSLPALWAYKIVTDDPEYKNGRIAQRLKLGTANELLFSHKRESREPMG
jgi:CYTH domain-containing protein/thymidylate kinase